VVVNQAQSVLDRLSELGIEGMILVGGEGTMHIAGELMKMGACIVGVPKTIDNDLPGTDLTFGFDTALHTATDAIDKLHTTAEAHHRVMVCEVMGRHVGWIALEAGLSGGSDVILIPEIPFDIDRVCAKVEQRNARGAYFSIIVVAEGAFPAGSQPMYRARGASGAASRLGGIGRWVADTIAERTGAEVRSIVLGHLQRGGSPSPYDRILATRLGAAAMRLVAARQWGRMVALHGTEIGDVSIPEVVAAGLKLVDPNGELVRTARELGIELGAAPQVPASAHDGEHASA
jgi:6-phosphofructokinase 1